MATLNELDQREKRFYKRMRITLFVVLGIYVMYNVTVLTLLN